MIRLLAVALFSLLPLAQAYAQAVNAPNAFDRFMEKTLGGGKQSVGFGKDGTPTINQGVPTVNTDGGLPRVDVGGSIRNPSGQLVPVNNTARVPGAEIGKAVGRAAVNVGTKLAAVVGVGLTLYDLAKEIDYILSRAPDGSLAVQKPDGLACTVAPCYQYQGMNDGLWYGSLYEAATHSVYAAPPPGCTGYSIFRWRLDGVTMPQTMNFTYGYCNNTYPFSPTSTLITRREVAPSPINYIPSTLQDLEAAIAAKSGWPSGSAVRRLLAEDYPAPADRVQPIAQTVSGPATSPGKQATTTNTTNNTTKTETTTHNHTYNTNVVTTTSTTVTNIYNPATNTTETETKTEEPDPEPDNDAEDTLLPVQPKLYEPKYPDGLVGVWTQKKAELLTTPLAGVLPQLMPSVGNGGSCPSWMLNLSLGSWDYGSHDVAPPCYIWDWCKFFIIAGALLLARALIFGG